MKILSNSCSNILAMHRRSENKPRIIQKGIEHTLWLIAQNSFSYIQVGTEEDLEHTMFHKKGLRFSEKRHWSGSITLPHSKINNLLYPLYYFIC